MGQSRHRVFGGLALAACVVGGVSFGSARAKETPQPPGGGHESALAVGQDAYIYGYPMMVVDETKQFSFKGVTNHFVYLPAPPRSSNKDVVRPSVDTLYTTAFLDLRAEPVVVHMPDTHGRYDVMEMLDANTNVFASPGKRTTGTAAHDFLIVGPDWSAPVQLLAGMSEIHAPTNSVWILNRTQLDGENDIPAVNEIQRKFAIAPLSQWPGGAIPASTATGDQQGSETPPARIEALDAPAYFDRLALLVLNNPPPPADATTLQRFASIGLIAGQPFKPSPDLALTLETAKDRALDRIKDKVANLGEVVNGWRIVTKDIGTYGTDYMQRAAVAVFGLGANLPADAVYPGTSVDETGQPLDGNKRYVLHFEKDQIPPVNAFWSVTMYDKDGYRVPNALGRYAARDSRLKKNSDGSIDIYLQADSPGKAREANWLPARETRRSTCCFGCTGPGSLWSTGPTSRRV